MKRQELFNYNTHARPKHPSSKHLPVRDVEAIQDVLDILASEELLETQLGNSVKVSPCLNKPRLKVINTSCMGDEG